MQLGCLVLPGRGSLGLAYGFCLPNRDTLRGTRSQCQSCMERRFGLSYEVGHLVGQVGTAVGELFGTSVGQLFEKKIRFSFVTIMTNTSGGPFEYFPNQRTID